MVASEWVSLYSLQPICLNPAPTSHDRIVDTTLIIVTDVFALHLYSSSVIRQFPVYNGIHKICTCNACACILRNLTVVNIIMYINTILICRKRLNRKDILIHVHVQ